MKRLDRWSWMILLFAFLIRLAAAWQWQSVADSESALFRFGDSDSYWVLAHRIANMENYEYGGENSRIFRAPLYPICLAPWTFFHDERTGVIAARCFGALLGTLAIWLVYASASELGGTEAGRWAAFLAAIYPGAIGMSVFVLSEAIFCPLILGSLLLWYRGQKENCARMDSISGTGSLGIFCASGIATGLASLARPSWILWPGCLVVVLAFQRRRGALRQFLFFLFGMTLMLIPWWGRNYWVAGKFVPTTLQVGASLYDGWHAGASGSSDEGMLFSEEFASHQNVVDEEDRRLGKALVSTMEYRLDRRLYSAAISWAWENPSDVVRLGLIKSMKTWSPWPTAGQVGNFWLRMAESVVYIAVLGLGLFGLYSQRQQFSMAMVFAFPCLYYGALHTIFVGSIRYRQPPILVLCILAGVGMSAILRSRKLSSI